MSGVRLVNMIGFLVVCIKSLILCDVIAVVPPPTYVDRCVRSDRVKPELRDRRTLRSVDYVRLFEVSLLSSVSEVVSKPGTGEDLLKN